MKLDLKKDNDYLRSLNIIVKWDDLKDDFCPPTIEEIQSLTQLETFIKQSKTCPLKNQAKQTVFSDGNPTAKIM